MDRKERSAKKISELFEQPENALAATDPNFQEMQERFIHGDVAFQGELSDQLRELITLVVLTTSQTLAPLNDHVRAALRIGMRSVEIKEAIYQCTPYIGFPKTAQAIEQVNAIFQEQNIALPLASQKQVTEETRFDKGLGVQKAIFGDIIDQMHKNTPANLKHIQNYLSAFCFGDIYTRSGLDLQTREILTLCILITLGGCESQVKSHIHGNLSVGNSRDTLIAVISQSLPYIGFPRTLNALACLNEVCPDTQQ